MQLVHVNSQLGHINENTSSGQGKAWTGEENREVKEKNVPKWVQFKPGHS